jgi:gamma-glutamyltranspeptidase/glutathione hydrolase
MTDGGIVFLESGVDGEVQRQLVTRGHEVQAAYGGFGGYQAIILDPETGVYHAATEMRKDGIVVGY